MTTTRYRRGLAVVLRSVAARLQGAGWTLDDVIDAHLVLYQEASSR